MFAATGGKSSSSSLLLLLLMDVALLVVVVVALLVMDALYAARDEWQLRDPGDTQDFKWSITGGEWSAKLRGSSVNAFQGSARNAESTQFCSRCRMPKTAGFSVSLYTDSGAYCLVYAWCHKMQFLYDNYCQHGFPAADFETALAGYIEPANFTDWAREASFAAQTRVTQIRLLRPRPALGA
ncbi:unnamed protein product [Polarella glacialis]|uniref:Uncharacterized protein n=1 Tax=Polarella glacialis TaxID=89957 RepID=A0A813IAH2_POLGL|nr:unnamed protein product [Polarella glacialis]